MKIYKTPAMHFLRYEMEEVLKITSTYGYEDVEQLSHGKTTDFEWSEDDAWTEE